MSNNGKVEARRRARELRAEAWTLAEIAAEVGASKSSVSLWVRDVEFEPRPRNRGHSSQKPHPLKLKVQAETELFRRQGLDRLGELDDASFLAAGAALYVGEGFKTGSQVGMANTDPAVIRFFVTWVRHFFEVDETRWKGRLYLHEGYDLEEAHSHWSDVAGIPVAQFGAAHRAEVDRTRRKQTHPLGCFTALYCSATMQREVLGLCGGLLSSAVAFRG